MGFRRIYGDARICFSNLFDEDVTRFSLRRQKYRLCNSDFPAFAFCLRNFYKLGAMRKRFLLLLLSLSLSLYVSRRCRGEIYNKSNERFLFKRQRFDTLFADVIKSGTTFRRVCPRLEFLRRVRGTDLRNARTCLA